MTEKRHLSNEIVCRTLNDLDVLYASIAGISDIENYSAISEHRGIVYVFVSNDEHAIEELHSQWNDYKGAI